MSKVIIAPDSFKGTLSSKEACDIVADSLEKRYEGIRIRKIPVADGGEGTAEAFLHNFGGEKILCEVRTPLDNKTEAYYVLLSDKTAVIEMALASGITIEKENDALSASSYGTGELIKKAMDDGSKSIIVCIGGSATTDGGTGCLAALGARFYDESGKEIRPCGGNLSLIEKIELSDFDKRLSEVKLTVLCDVENTLYGEKGAAYVFAPQKGADDKQVKLLDEGLKHFAGLCSELFGKDYSSFKGAGAAGGLGFALKAFCDADFEKGIDYVLDFYGFEKEAADADLIITGEGKLDSQSLMGKVPFGVASRCKGKRVIALVGVSEVEEAELYLAGISEVLETNPLHLPFESIKDCAKAMLYEAATKIKL